MAVRTLGWKFYSTLGWIDVYEAGEVTSPRYHGPRLPISMRAVSDLRTRFL